MSLHLVVSCIYSRSIAFTVAFWMLFFSQRICYIGSYRPLNLEFSSTFILNMIRPIPNDCL